MGITTLVKAAFAGIVDLGRENTSVSTSGKTLTAGIVKFLMEMSRFDMMKEDDIFEQLYAFEAEAGGGIDRLSTLASTAFGGWTIRDTDTTRSPEEKEMLRLAQTMGEGIQINEQIEAMTELLMMFGNIYLKYNKGQITYLPNKFVSFIESMEDKDQMVVDRILYTPAIMTLYENDSLYETEVLNPSEYRHIKYKLTPIHMKDCMGRKTYGFYSISPLQRAILPTWWKRQTMIIDILWRWKNLPREHHKIDSSAFTLDKYIGSKKDRITQAQDDAQAEIARYTSSINELQPDQGYVSLNNLDISTIESRTQHTSVNELSNQLDQKIWSAINVPESIVNGRGAGSYASELVISNYVSAKIVAIVNKFKPILLEMVRDRILMVNPTLPVEKLDMNVKLMIAASELELFREAAIMATLGIFTPDEVRELLSYPNLTDDQRKELMEIIRQKAKNERSNKGTGDAMKSQDGTYPETPQSDQQHTRDTGQNIVRNAET
jgi:hypothetical protein